MARSLVLLSFVLLGLIGSAFSQEAVAILRGTANDNNIWGYVRLYASSATTVSIDVSIQGISQNTGALHGFHIHEYGDISDQNGAQGTGSHYNPLNVPHGCPNTTQHHVGDLGTVSVSATGTVSTTLGPFSYISLSGANSVVGRAIVLHALPDDCVDTGSSGVRLAQGVIGIRQVSSNTAIAASTITTAVCELKGTTDHTGIGGRVLFKTVSGGVEVTASITGLTLNSTHGFHIHQYGDLFLADGLSTGGHYNPHNQEHGIPPTSLRHVGDMGNIYYYEADVAYYKYTNDLIKLGGNVPENVVGHAIVLHGNLDNCSPGTGGAGARYATCVIGVANPTTTVTIPGTVPTTQDNSKCPLSTTAAPQPASDATLARPILCLALIALLALFF